MPVRRHPVATSPQHASLHRLPLDLALVERLRTTHTLVRAHELEFARLFYSKLFEAAPHLRAMFKSDLGSQAAKLTASLDAVVRNLEKPHENAAMLADLGRRHAGYGARPEHYDLVVELLGLSMQEVLHMASDDQAIVEWRMALRLIADQMIAAAAQARVSG
jgi:hemoglobin-like flavoprotein